MLTTDGAQRVKASRAPLLIPTTLRMQIINSSNNDDENRRTYTRSDAARARVSLLTSSRVQESRAGISPPAAVGYMALRRAALLLAQLCALAIRARDVTVMS